MPVWILCGDKFATSNEGHFRNSVAVDNTQFEISRALQISEHL